MKVQQDIHESISCLDNEDLVNKAYDGLLATMNFVKMNKHNQMEINTINGLRKKDYSIFTPIISGIYIPGSQRSFWAGFVDPSDYPLPEQGCVYITPRYSDVAFEFITIKRVKNFPSKVICSCKTLEYIYKTFNTFIYKNPMYVPTVEESYYGIAHDGSVYTTIDKLKLRHAYNSDQREISLLRREYANAEVFTTGAISLLADRRYLWNIKTTEPINSKMNAIVNFGVEEELVKSLVFARDNPLTYTGRKRPILHWVRMHKRRIKENIKINIRKHLRGITEFKMGELTFQITQPIKGCKT